MTMKWLSIWSFIMNWFEVVWKNTFRMKSLLLTVFE